MDQSSTRYRNLLFSFRIKNTLKLEDGKCACLSCRKLFRSVDFLILHFERSHALELQALKQQSQAEPPSRHVHRSRTSTLRPGPTDPGHGLSAVQRAEHQTSIDIDKTQDK
jgi:hypothetical protein